MTKTINFIIAVFLLLSAITVSARDVEPSDTVKVYTLEGVSVTASRIPVQLGKSARMVTVLDSVALASIPAETVNDILKVAVGVDVRQRGVMGMQTDVSMRGGTFDQIAVLLDGINISDPQTGHNAADFPVDVHDIERIEILEGPAARVYGTSSLVGAINVVTKKAARTADGKNTTLSAHAEGGSYGYFNGGASVGNVHGNLSNKVSGSWSRSDGYSRNSEGGLNSDFNAVKGFYEGSLKTDVADISWYGGVSMKNFGSNTFYSAKYDDQFEHTLKTYAAVQAETRGWLHFRPSIYWNRTQDRFELFRDNPDAVAFNHHRTNVYGLNLGSWFESPLGRTAFGAEMRNEDIISTNLGDALNTPKKVPGYDAYYKVGLNRTNISFYLEHNVVLESFSLSAGAVVSENTGNEDGFGIYPGIDASYRFGDRWKVYGSFNTSYRMPTFTELYYSVGGHKADKYLKAERMNSIEGGLKYSAPWLYASGCVYYHHGLDMIDWILDSSETDAYWKSVNFTQINTLGEEVSLRFNLPAMIGETPLRTLVLSYSHIDQDKKAVGSIQSRYALEYLRNKFVAQLQTKFWSRLGLDLTCSWIDRVGTYTVYENKNATGVTESFKPYTLLDMRLHWDAPRYTIYVEADNLLDKTYYDHGNIPQPGLWAKAGVIVNIGI